MRRWVTAVLLAVLLLACDSQAPETGEEVAADAGCFACHTETSTDLAPTWHGIWGTAVALGDGSTVVVDEEYVLRSIEEPAADVVAGYEAKMPRIPLDENEKQMLVDYIRSLQ